MSLKGKQERGADSKACNRPGWKNLVRSRIVEDEVVEKKEVGGGTIRGETILKKPS